jgi:hypothetical protein
MSGVDERRKRGSALSKFLDIYLNDHLAGATAGRELAKRALSENAENDFGRYLGGLVSDIESDIGSLEDLMERLEVSTDRLKTTAAWVLEKVGRLKLNGQLWGYSPLSRLVELESLALGVEGKLSLWRSLAHTLESDSRVKGFDFEALIRSAERQRAELEVQRLRAAEQVLSPVS